MTSVGTEPRPRRTLLIGSMDAGKTALLGSALAACRPPPDGRGHDLKLIQRPGEAGNLVHRALADIFAGARTAAGNQATAQKVVHEIVVRATPIPSGPQTYDHTLAILDTPGGHLIGPDAALRSEHAQGLHDEASRASTLILCVDLNRPAQLDLFVGIQELIAGAARPDGSDPPAPETWGAALRGRLFGRPEPAGARESQSWLPFRRVLVLLTKLDEWAARHAPPGVRPYEVATALDPIKAGVRAVGLPLYWLHQNLRPDTEVAIGTSSAWGFHATSGRPFTDEVARWVAAYPGDPQVKHALVHEWRPYGVRSALVYAATGATDRHVRRLERNHLHDLRH